MDLNAICDHSLCTLPWHMLREPSFQFTRFTSLSFTLFSIAMDCPIDERSICATSNQSMSNQSMSNQSMSNQSMSNQGFCEPLYNPHLREIIGAACWIAPSGANPAISLDDSSLTINLSPIHEAEPSLSVVVAARIQVPFPRPSCSSVTAHLNLLEPK